MAAVVSMRGAGRLLAVLRPGKQGGASSEGSVGGDRMLPSLHPASSLTRPFPSTCSLPRAQNELCLCSATVLPHKEVKESVYTPTIIL